MAPKPTVVEDSPEARSRLRINEQAALMLNVESLITYKPENSTQSQLEFVDYKNFCAFRTDESGESKQIGSSGLTGGGHISLTNRLYRSAATSMFFKKATTSVLSSLTPSIKLYKTFFPNHGDKKNDNRDSVSYSWRIPFDDISFNTQNPLDTSQFIESTDEILKGSGRGHGVGIKSFSYSYVGVNPAEVNTNISAELQLYFQDVTDLIKTIKVNEKDSGFDGENAPENSEYEFSYCDLVVDSSSKLKSKEANDKYFRMKAIVGYNDPSELYWKSIQSSGELTEEELKNLRIAIKNAQVILYLNPHNHNIEFQDNGTIILKIEYIAAITSIMNNLDCLAISPLHDELRTQKEDYENAAAASIADNQRRAELCEASDEKTQANQDVLETELKIENTRNELISEIFKKIIGLRSYSTETNVYQVDLRASVLGVNETGNLMGDATQARIESLGESSIKNFKKLSSKEIDRGPLTEKYNKVIKETGFFGGDIGIAKTDVEKAREKLSKTNERKRLEARAGGREDAGLFAVQFVFLGQLFDIFCEVINKELKDPTEKPRIILNDFSIEVPKSVKLTADGKPSTETINNSVTLNMVDIPISLAMLQQLFIEKVVKPNRTKYPLTQFLNDVMTDIVAPAVSPSVFGVNTRFNTSVRMSSLNLSLPFIDGNDCITKKTKIDNFSGVVKEKDVNDNLTTATALNFGNSIKNNIGNYQFIYCSSQLPNLIKNGKGEEADDEKNGIYHMRIGADRGILKKISFSKTNLAFSKEMRSQTSTGDKSVDRVREVYDSDVSLFGNNIFRPGDFIYIEPLIFTGKQAVDIQNKIGLGGYYQVVTVKTSMTDNMYDTSLTTVLAGHIQESPVRQVVSETSNKGC